MFTGLIETTGTVLRVEERGAMRRIAIAAPVLALRPGDSIAVSGVCLTAVDLRRQAGSMHFEADLAAETVAKTSLAQLARGSVVNLELPTPAAAPLGGHIVQGHVDGTGRLLGLTRWAPEPAASGDWRLRIALPPGIGRYIVEKGSIAVEGISLTVAKWMPEADQHGAIEIAIIPHTYAHTNLRALEPGRALNLEADVMLKFFEQRRQDAEFAITFEWLIANGF